MLGSSMDRGAMPLLLLLVLCGLLQCTNAVPVIPRSVAPPTSLTATTINSSAIRLTWRAAVTSSGSISSYRIYRNNSLLISLSGSALTYTDNSLSPSTSYSYQLRAYNSLAQVCLHRIGCCHQWCLGGHH